MNIEIEVGAVRSYLSLRFSSLAVRCLKFFSTQWSYAACKRRLAHNSSSCRCCVEAYLWSGTSTWAKTRQSSKLRLLVTSTAVFTILFFFSPPSSSETRTSTQMLLLTLMKDLQSLKKGASLEGQWVTYWQGLRPRTIFFNSSYLLSSESRFSDHIVSLRRRQEWK